MSRKVASKEIEQILAFLQQYPEGASAEVILQGLPNEISKRTLQRRLAKLIVEQQVVRVGEGAASHYQLATTPVKITSAHAYDYIPLSSPAESLREAIHQPLSLRRPVSYDRALLDAYEPNVTYYLPVSLRQRLMNWGQISKEQQPAGTYAKKILERLSIDLSWNSSRLEGNTYSLLETARLLEQGEASTGKQQFEAQMILNHKAAIDFMISSAEDIDFNRYTILNLHALLSDNLLPNPAACGRLRQIPVGIAGTVYYPLEIPQAIEEFFQQILDKAKAIIDPFEQAFFVMLHIPYLQPFEDVNKRVSRLAANLPLFRKNLCPLSFIDVPEQAYIDATLAVYEFHRYDLLRDVFEWAYQRSALHYAALQQSLGEPDPFKWRYRKQIALLMKQIVSLQLNKEQAIQLIQQAANLEVPVTDHQKFIEMVDREIMSLHEGNIARYQIRREEYAAWRALWD
jgi:Fic family protein